MALVKSKAVGYKQKEGRVGDEHFAQTTKEELAPPKNFQERERQRSMKRSKLILLAFDFLFFFSTKAFADSPQPGWEILAETVWVNVKNQVAITKVLQILRNPTGSDIQADFNFPLSEKDTLVDFGVSRKNDSIISGASDSSQPAAPAAFTETADSASGDSQAFLVRLAPGEIVSVLLVYQTGPDTSGNRFRYVFPLKESFQTKGAIGSFAFYADIEEKDRVMEVKTEGYSIVVRGNGPKLRAYFWQNNLLPKSNIGFSYRVMRKKPETDR